MIKVCSGNILEAKAEALVNPVNCVGVMGKGLAWQFRLAYPEMYERYRGFCQNDLLEPGIIHIYATTTKIPRFIFNFPTKVNWRDKSRIDWIEEGLEALIETCQHMEVDSIAIPPLGCGLGGLDWKDVKPLIEEAFTELPDVQVLLYEPVTNGKAQDGQ